MPSYPALHHPSAAYPRSPNRPPAVREGDRENTPCSGGVCRAVGPGNGETFLQFVPHPLGGLTGDPETQKATGRAESY